MPELGEIDRELALKLPIAYAKKAVTRPAPKRRNGKQNRICRYVRAAHSLHGRRPIVLLNGDISLCLAGSEKILDTLNRLHSEDMNKAEDTVQEMEEEDLSFLAAAVLDERTGLLSYR